MSKTLIKKYVSFMIVGVILNLGLYYVAHVFKLPVWIDSIGTAVTAMALEPAAGLLVAFATNFFQAAVIYDSSSLIYYAVSASAAIVFGVCMRKAGKIELKRLPISLLTYAVTASVLGAAITLWRTAGVPDSGWERHFYEMALGNGIPNVLACLWGTFILKAADSVIIGVVLAASAKLLPKKFINEQMEETVSTHNPFFIKKNNA